MKTTIVEKLDKFLKQETLLKEEYGVVYLMVELRKLLEWDNLSNEYPLVRFHADWTVHIKKDKITAIMKKIMEKIDNSLSPYPKDGNMDFLLMPEFRTELIKLLNKYNLPDSFLKSEKGWLDFVMAVIQVLADQPIINPSKNIAEFRYVDVKKEGVMATIDFRGSKAGGGITLGFGA